MVILQFPIRSCLLLQWQQTVVEIIVSVITDIQDTPEGNLYPFGICTDVFSHILISDINSGSIHMLDEKSQFLSFLLINALESFGPYTLSYDVNTQNLWVGTGNNNIIYAFKYIDRQDIVTRKFVSQYFFNDKFRRKFQKFDILHLEQ